MRQNTTVTRPYESALAINKVLKNTYLLLSLTLLFSAATAGFAMSINAKPVNFFILLVVILGGPYLVMALRNSAWGLLALFAFTGILGYTLGPILNFYIHNFANGSQIVMSALGATGVIFLGLSGYALVSKKDFSYLGGFIAVGILAAFVVGIGAIVFNLPILQLIISGAFAVLSSAYILFTTSRIINGGERNYIVAAISLYIAIFNLFTSLLRILGFFAGTSRN